MYAVYAQGTHYPQMWTTHTLHTLYAVLYSLIMAKNKEKADAAVRIYKSTRKRLNVKAAQKSTTLAEIVDQLSLREPAPKE